MVEVFDTQRLATSALIAVFAPATHVKHDPAALQVAHEVSHLENLLLVAS
jgi:hypothetical protein